MRKANVSQLRARLSAYLDDVRNGATVVVIDRRTPVARLVPYLEDEDRIEEATAGIERLRGLKPVKPRRPVDVVALLREGRDQR